MALVAVLGAGVMGETLLSGLLRSGRQAGDLVIAERRPDRAHELTERYGVEVLGNAEAAARAETVVLVVKPQDMGALLDEIGPHLREGALVVSLAAGITTSFIEGRLAAGVPVVRVMPNTPALVDEGMAAISPGSHCVHLGLPRATASELVVQTVVGAAKMLRETGEHPVVLRENVTSPAGTTAAALRELEDHKVRAAFLTALEAARDRSRALASGQD